MTIYGGFDTMTYRAYDTVYVLAIPAFRWIKISDKRNEESVSLSRNTGSHQHSCALYGDRQMLVLGGIPGSDIAMLEVNISCDRSSSVIRILDTTRFEWQKEFDPSPEPYRVPEAVTSVIGGRLVC